MARYTIALYYALSELNISAETIAALLADINYQLVRRPQMLLNRISASRFRDPLLRLRWKSQLARRFYYRSPDWVMKEVPVADGYGLDVQRCIIADYFQSLGLGKLCEQTICIQDFRLADRRGDCLIRTETIAGSAKRCDFRYLRTQATGENCDHRKTVTPAPSP
jgi:ubiquinone biosynthesis protein